MLPKEKKATLIRKAKDGRKYTVFAQVSLSDTTRKIHSDAYAKEYWMPDETHPYFYLLDRSGEKVSDDLYVELTTGEIELAATARYIFI